MKPKAKLRAFLALAGSSLLAVTCASATTYYWDSDNATPGFGSSVGTWSSSVSSASGNGFTTDASGSTDITGNADVATAAGDDINFGNGLNLTSAATTISDATVTCLSTANLKVGMTVTGTGIPAATTVLSITDGTTFELSANATATNSGLTLSAVFTYTGATTINGTVLATRVYQQSSHPTFVAGTAPKIDFGAAGIYESSNTNRGFPVGLEVTGTQLTWKSIRNMETMNVTSTVGKTILSTSSESTLSYPGRVKMKVEANLGAANAPLVFDHGTLSMQNGFPYTSLSALHAAHPVSFVANKNAGLDNSTGLGGTAVTFTVDQPIDLGTGVFYTESSGGTAATIKLTSTGNNWSGIRMTTGILEIDDLAQLGPSSASLRFGTGTSELANGTLRITGTSVTSLGTHPMLTTDTKGVSFDIADAANTFTVDQALNQGTGGFTKSGAGSLIINTTSTYTGLTTVSGGKLSFGTSAGLPTTTVTVNGADAVLDLGAYNPSVTTVTLQNGSVTGSGTLTGTSFVLSGASPAVMNIPVKLAGAAATLAKSGTGTATLSGDNSLVGGAVTISNGMLNINSTTALGAGAVTISGGTIDNTSGSAKTLTTNNPVTFGGNFAFSTASGTSSNNLNFGSGAITMAAGRTITLNGTGSTLTFGGVLTNTQAGNPSLTVNNGTSPASGNALVIGGLALSGPTDTSNRTVTITGTANTTINGAVTSGGNGTVTASALTKTGTGTLTLNGNNTYDGLTTHSTAGSTLTLAGDNSGAAGGLTMNNATAVLNINSTTALGTGTFSLTTGIIDNTSGSAKTLTLANPITIGGNFTFGGTNPLNLGTGAITNTATSRTITLNGTGSSLTLGGVMTNGFAGTQTTTVNGVGNTLSLGGYALSNSATSRTGTFNGDGNVTITGAVTNGGTATASLLTYSGTGTLTLKGTNSYAGATTVSSGCLALVGGSQNSEITVSSGAFLGFTLGQSTTSTKAVTLSTGSKVRITGTPTPGTSYTLLTTSAFVTYGDPNPVLETPLGTHALVVEGGNTLLLKSLSTPFQDWALLKGLDGTTGKENGKADDPDGDGKNNNFEFAFNGDPLDGSDNGMIAGLVQDASAPAGNELTLVVAVRDGATFGNAGSPVVQTATVDGVSYTIEGALDLVTIPGSDVSHAAGPADTAPLATGLPDLTGTDWEYHTFKLDASEGLGSKGFLRAKAE